MKRETRRGEPDIIGRLRREAEDRADSHSPKDDGYVGIAIPKDARITTAIKTNFSIINAQSIVSSIIFD